MHTPKKRHAVAAVLALAFSALPAAAGLAPAHAEAYCQYFEGPTPSAEVDLENDGNPEVRVPSLSNVSVCAQADVLVHGEPLRVERCDWLIDCWRILVHPQAGVTIYSGLEVCRSVDGGLPTCSTVNVGPWHYETPPANTICIGIHLRGGYPCGDESLIVLGS